MRNFLKFNFLLFLIYGMLSCNKSCPDCEKQDCKQVDGWGNLLMDKNQKIYVPNQLIVVFKETPTDATRKIIRDKLLAVKIQIDSIKSKKCSDCDGYVELWQGEGIHTFLSGPGSAFVRNTTGAGDDPYAHYSLNFLSTLPKNAFEINTNGFNQNRGGDVIKVAVLDSGLDSTLIARMDTNFLWKSRYGSNDKCYTGATYGWNFVDKNSNIYDKNPGLHGTLVTQFVLNQMSSQTKNTIEIMTLKTHGKDNQGNLFDIICAIHFAIKNNANIINASWGFYYFDEIPHPYLNELINDTLQKRGILFVAAAGNKSHNSDSIARVQNIRENELRSLDKHKFYPACLSNPNNSVITVTTTDSKTISKHQNYSGNFVDIAVFADIFRNDSMLYQWPILSSQIELDLNGSSFATPIVAGAIAANISLEDFTMGIRKEEILVKLNNVIVNERNSLMHVSEDLKNLNYVRKGRYLKNEKDFSFKAPNRDKRVRSN